MGDETDAIMEAEEPLLERPSPHPSPDAGLPSAPATGSKEVPEVEVQLYRRGRGPVEVFRSRLGGWEQDQLEVQDILDRHGLKSLYAFHPSTGRGVPIRFSPRNGRSVLTYSDGAAIILDGEPKDSMVKPVTKILVGVAVLSLLIALVLKDPPEWFNLSRLGGGTFPPWVLACAVIVFSRMRKRTRDFLKKFGW